MLRIVKGNRRYRYISFRIVYENGNTVVTNSTLIQALRQRTIELFSKNIKELGLWMIWFDGTTGILKCHYREKDNVKLLLQSLKILGTNHVVVTTSATSGTIRGIMHRKEK